MKVELFNNQANSIWKKVTSEAVTNELRLELDLYKKLLSFFQVGDYYYWIFNLKDYQLDLVSDSVRTVLGYEPSDFNLQFLLDKIHPEDRPWFLNFENKTAGFLLALPPEKITKYKTRYNYRIKNSDGGYTMILHQVIVIEHDNNGQLLRTLGVHTDITHLKLEGKPIFSIIGLDGEPSYINIDVDEKFAISNEVLSRREKQILLLIMDGKLSKEISAALNISKQTVDSHRNNMITKCNVANTSELIAKAIRQGWV